MKPVRVAIPLAAMSVIGLAIGYVSNSTGDNGRPVGRGSSAAIPSTSLTAGATVADTTTRATTAGVPSATSPSTAAATTTGTSTAPAASAADGRRKLQVGVNLSSICDWGTQWAFVDVFQHSRPWIAQTVDPSGPWDTGERIETDRNGWPILKPGQAAGTLMCRDQRGRYPGGVYVCTYEGSGKLQFLGDVVKTKAVSRNRAEITVVPADAGIHLKIIESDPRDPIRNVHVWMPGFEGTTSPFHPLFLERLKPFKTIRFMNWGGGNNDPSVRWPDRTRLDSARQSEPRGAAVEHMIDLCNTLGADPWLCMPYQADDEYVRNYARLVRSRLRPDRKVYVEWSNEAWNTLFEQARWVFREAENRRVEWPYVIADEANRDWKIWVEEFGDQSDRLVRVAAGQHYNPWVCGKIAERLDGAFDAISCSAYFMPPDADVAKFNDKTDARQVLDSAVQNLRSQDYSLLLKHHRLADLWSKKTGREIRFLAYEAGQHIIPIKGFGGGDDKETEWASAALRVQTLPEMYDAYWASLNHFAAAGGDLYMAFVYVDPPGKYGSWGALEYQGQPVDDAPKYRALTDYIAADK